jgi:predicted O-linked N-acetylglucosamine transferase (SPINDLY family)
MASNDAAIFANELQRGLALHRLGRLEDAQAFYRRALERQPEEFRPLHLLAMIAWQTNQHELALDLNGRALAVNPRNASAYNLHGNVLLALGRCETALAHYETAVAIEPDHAEAHYNRGNALFDAGRHEAAIESFDQAIRLRRDWAEAHANRGLALARLQRHTAAIASFTEVIALRPDGAEAYAFRGNSLAELRRIGAAVEDFDRAIELRPDYAEACNGRGSAQARLRQFERALADYDRAIALKPDFAEAYSNRGNVCKALGRRDAALADYATALALRPRCAEAHYNLGDTHRSAGRYEEAARHFDQAFTLAPHLQFLAGARRHAHVRLCNWGDYEREVGELEVRVGRGEAVTPPFVMLALSGSPARQLEAARIWVRKTCPADDTLGAIAPRAAGARLRVGYFSPDFRDHPVARLIAELIERHDRSAFEVTGFSFGAAEPGDALRERLAGAFERFVDASALSDLDAARLARELELDIAVDLGGFTEQCRTGVFALRAAPLQVSYLGYLGSLGAPYMDYLIADATLVPAAQRPHYAEQILYLPSYQANDSRRCVADKIFTRAEIGLPVRGFVFCCYNGSYKITPTIFAIWMRILARVPGSVLLLYAGNATVEQNLRGEAVRGGIDPARLVFAARLAHPEYLARYRAADLFLDTLPYNAGTTASDALWMGLPVLSCVGESFAGRMAASLLRAVGLPELITDSLEQYEELAVALAHDTPRLAALKRLLAEKRDRSALFNAACFTRYFERGLRAIHRRYLEGLAPQDTWVAGD